MIKQINSNTVLKKLIIDNATFPEKIDKKLVISAPNLETLIINCSAVSLTEGKITDFDFNKCSKLKKLAFGNGTHITNLDGLSQLKNLEAFSFGRFQSAISFDLNKTYEEKEDEINHTHPLDHPRIGVFNNNFITDISGLKGLNIETLNITSLQLISDKQLLDLVISLQKLQRVVGLEGNNADMYSPEFEAFCREHHIEQPFTENSRLIKTAIKSVIISLELSDKDEFEKIKAISKHVLNHLTYLNEETDGMSPEEASFVRQRQWGNNLSYAAIKRIALCMGYTDYTQALLTEAGVENSRAEVYKHIFNLVNVKGIYFELDLTQLDALLDEEGIDPNDYNFQMSVRHYMVPLGIKDSQKAATEPTEATAQREEYKNIFGSNYGVFDVLDEGAKEISQNSNIFALLALLSVLGIAIPISIQQVQRLSEQAVATAAMGVDCPIWTQSDMDKLINDFNKEQVAKTEDELYIE